MMRKLGEFFKEYIGENIRSIILFGSYARKEQKETSDIDILIISDTKIKDIQKTSKNFLEKFGKVLSIINLTKKEFMKKIIEGNSQLLVIFLEGKVIFDDGTFRRGKNLYIALHRKENWIVKYGGKVWSPKMLNTQWTF